MKKAWLDKAAAERIAAEIPTPFHIYNAAEIRRRTRALYEAFSWNKGYKEYFAVKATPNPAVLALLHKEGCGTDCSSYTELLMSERCGFKGEEIMFSSNNTPAADFRLSARLGAVINFDDLKHLPFYLKEVEDHFPKLISFRYNPGGVYEVANGIMDNPGEAKYGMTDAQIRKACRLAAEHGAERIGIHAFLVSNAIGNDYYPQLARTLFTLAVQLQKECGVKVDFVNLSGGIGIPYRPEQEEVDIKAVGEGVRRAFAEILEPEGLGDIRIFTELGRYLLAPSGALITRCLHLKETYKNYLGTDACAANLMRPAMYGAYHHITILGKEEAPCDTLYDVTGGLCENNDKFAVDRLLPAAAEGDLLYIHDTGAHGFAMGYNYNGKLRSAEVMLEEDGTFRMIRRAETPADYFATLEGFWPAEAKTAERCTGRQETCPGDNE